ncbi:MAG: YiiX/YebB-like N1pC/P60 family cysteine hydrolase [candidate division Zixibacteria bacterium]
MNSRLKITLRISIVLISLYLLLLIPVSSIPEPEPGAKEPFLWNQDDYFSLLESLFIEARSLEPDSLSIRINRQFAEIKKSIKKLFSGFYDPTDVIFDNIEIQLFELAPLIAAEPEKLLEFIKVYGTTRNAVKDQSRRWDMNTKEARHRIYRLMYGGRAAVEEAMLQSPAGTYPAMIHSRDEPSVTPSTEIRGVTIHSGDILVSRGGAPTSALIARGNDYPGNFSHVAFVYIDEKTGEPLIIESHIEIGVTASTVEQYLGDMKLRIMALRLRADLPSLTSNPMLPHKAAMIAYERAKSEHIAYDFEMDYNDPTELFCSEVASAPYSRLGIRLWAGISNISSPGVRSWLAAFGVRYFQTQEPSDLEYDPQLAVVAEWRDPETLYKDHLDNAVIDIMLEGAEKGERLKYDWYMLPIGRIAKLYSVILNRFGKAGPIPEGMSAESALINDRFSRTHTKIKKSAAILAKQFEIEKGYRPPYWELVRLTREAKETQ